MNQLLTGGLVSLALLAGACSGTSNTETIGSGSDVSPPSEDGGSADQGDTGAFGSCRAQSSGDESAFSPFADLFSLDLAWYDVPVEVVGIGSDISIVDNSPISTVGRIKGADAGSFQQIAVTLSPSDEHSRRPTGDDPVESLILQAATIEDLRSEAGPGDRVLIGAHPSRSGWVTRFALIQRGDEILVTGQCGNNELVFLQDFAKTQGLTTVATVQALLSEATALVKFEARIAQVFDDADAGPTPWIERDARDRQLGNGEEPAEVTRRIDSITVEWQVPQAWRDLEGDICTWTDDGWGSCFSLAEGEGWATLDLVTYATKGGTLEYWLRMNDGNEYLLGMTPHQDLLDRDLVISPDRQLDSLIVRLSDAHEQTADLLAALSQSTDGLEVTVQ